MLSLTHQLENMALTSPTISSNNKKTRRVVYYDYNPYSQFPSGRPLARSLCGCASDDCRPTHEGLKTRTRVEMDEETHARVVKHREEKAAKEKAKVKQADSSKRKSSRISAEKKVVREKQEAHDSSIQFAYGTSTTLPRKRKRDRFHCIVCMADFSNNVPHNTEKCNHSMCRECVRQYFQSLLEKPMKRCDVTSCPNPYCKEYFVCDKILYSFLTKSEIKKWWTAAIIQSEFNNKIYCPMPGCKAVFDADPSLLKKCNFTVCYECNRGFCITCQKPWHPGQIKFIDDEADLIKTLKKAEASNWTRCPKCSVIVEKIQGCSTVVCSCRAVFCYRCGGISDDHTCRNRCDRLSTEQIRSLRSPMFKIDKKQKK